MATVDSHARTAVERWRLEIPGDVVPQTVTRVQNGKLLVAIEFNEVIEIPKHGKFQSKGEKDILILQLNSTGEVESTHQIGGKGNEEVDAMSTGNTGLYLAFRTDHSLTVAGKALSLPKPVVDYLPAQLGIIVEINNIGKPRRVITSFPNVQGLTVAPLPETSLVVSTYHNTAEDKEFTKVQLLNANGGTQWETKLNNVQVNHLTYSNGAVLAATRANNELGVVRFDLAAGEQKTLSTIQKTPGGDLGSIRGFVEWDTTVLAYGHSGREPVVKNGQGYSHSIEPFVIDASGMPSAQKIQLADATADVIAAGLLNEAPAAIINVIHDGALYGGQSPPHRGVYLALGSKPPIQFVPLYQVDFEIDDPEDLFVENPYGKETIIYGKPIFPWESAISDDTITLIGRCHQNEEGCCVAQYSVQLAKGG